MIDDVLVAGFGSEFTMSEYARRFNIIERRIFELYDKYDLDSSGLIFGDSEDDDNGRFLWPVFFMDELRDSQGYCDLFSGEPEDQALFVFEQLMDTY